MLNIEGLNILYKYLGENTPIKIKLLNKTKTICSCGKEYNSDKKVCKCGNSEFVIVDKGIGGLINSKKAYRIWVSKDKEDKFEISISYPMYEIVDRQSYKISIKEKTSRMLICDKNGSGKLSLTSPSMISYPNLKDEVLETMKTTIIYKDYEKKFGRIVSDMDYLSFKDFIQKVRKFPKLSQVDFVKEHNGFYNFLTASCVPDLYPEEIERELKIPKSYFKYFKDFYSYGNYYKTDYLILFEDVFTPYLENRTLDMWDVFSIVGGLNYLSNEYKDIMDFKKPRVLQFIKDFMRKNISIYTSSISSIISDVIKNYKEYNQVKDKDISIDNLPKTPKEIRMLLIKNKYVKLYPTKKEEIEIFEKTMAQDAFAALKKLLSKGV